MSKCVPKHLLFTAMVSCLSLFTVAAKPKAEASLSRAIEAAEDASDDGNLKKALGIYEDALALAKRSGNKAEMRTILKGIVLTTAGLRDWGRGYTAQAELLRLLGDKSPELADETMNAAVLAVRARKHDEASRLLNKAELSYRAERDEYLLGKVQLYKGINALHDVRYKDTVSHYLKSREHYQAVRAEGMATLRLLDIGNVYQEYLSDYRAAIRYYVQAAREYKESGNSRGYLAVQVDMGNAMTQLGQIDQATILLERVQQNISKGKDPRQWIRATQMLANANFRAGRYDRSLAGVKLIMETVKLVDKQRSRASLTIDAINLKAMVEAQLGRYDVAFKDFDRAMARAREFDMKTKQAYLYNNIGYWLRQSGKYRQSIIELNKALKIDLALNSKEGQAFDYRNLGLSHTRMGQLDKGNEFLNKALVISESGGNAYNTAYCYIGLGEIELLEKKWSAAAASFSKSLKTAEESSLLDFVWRSHGGLGQAYARQRDRKSAKKHFNRALATIEKMESDLKSDESRRGFKEQRDVQDVYRIYESILVDYGDRSEAMKIKERAKVQLPGR